MKTLRLREIREARGLTKTEVAEMAGLSQPFIGQLETGRRSPTLRTLNRLADALGVDVSELVKEEAV